MEDRKAPTLTPVQLETALNDYLTETDAAKTLGLSRQAFHRRSDQFKRGIGRIKSPHGWLYSVGGLSRYQEAQGLPAVSATSATPFPL